MANTGLPEFREWSIAAVQIFKARSMPLSLACGTSCSAQSHLEGFFGRLGLLLVVDESEGLAYLRQASEDELPDGYEGLPKLFRKTRLGYDATLLCVLLREDAKRVADGSGQGQRLVYLRVGEQPVHRVGMLLSMANRSSANWPSATVIVCFRGSRPSWKSVSISSAAIRWTSSRQPMAWR